METEQTNQTPAMVEQTPMTQEQIMQEILENSRQTKKYIKWQLYITLVLVVLPLLAMVFVIPMVIRSLGSLGSIYGAGELLQ